MRATIEVRPGRLSNRCDVEPGALEVGLQQVGVADLVAGVGSAVVDALVADQLLQELGRRSAELLGTRHALEPTPLINAMTRSAAACEGREGAGGGGGRVVA